MPYDDGSAILGNSGEDVTDFPYQYHPLKSPLNPDLRHSCVRIVCPHRRCWSNPIGVTLLLLVRPYVPFPTLHVS